MAKTKKLQNIKAAFVTDIYVGSKYFFYTLKEVKKDETDNERILHAERRKQWCT